MERNKRLTNLDFRRFRAELETLTGIYREENLKKETDWEVYEREYAHRIRYVSKELNHLAIEATKSITISKSQFGRPPKLSDQQRVVALLIKSIIIKSNRKMAGLLSIFGSLVGIDVSYKTVERLYSNPVTRMIMHNMFILTIKKKGIRNAHTTGDGTGYSLTVTKHYRTQGSKEGNRNFTYSFNLMDLKTQLYICYGSGISSEKEAFRNAMKMLEKVKRSTGMHVKSVRLDRYYSFQSTLDFFDNKTTLYIMPKSNTKINGPKRWRNIFRRMVDDPMSYLKEYYKRENSESGFSVDKGLTGSKIWQRNTDRIDTAVGCIATIHNLFRLYPS